MKPLYVGPSKYKIIEHFDFEAYEFVRFLESKREKLDTYHRHVAVVSVSPQVIQSSQETKSGPSAPPFVLNFAVAPSGEKLVGLSLSNPMQRSPTIHKLTPVPGAEAFALKYRELFRERAESSVLQCGILKLPFKTRFVAVSGTDEFLAKELFTERLLGAEALSFATKVNDEIIERIERFRDGTFGKCRTVVTDDGILLFLIDRTVDEDMRPLLSEVVSLLRKKYDVRPGNFYPIKDVVIGSFATGMEELFSNEPFRRISQLLEHYERIRRELEKLLKTDAGVGRETDSGHSSTAGG